MRIRNIINELREEKLDIIRWSEDAAEYIKSSLKPAQVTRMMLNEKQKHGVVLVEPDQLSIAIGKGGQNVRLASKLVGWEIDVMTPEECEKRLMAERGKMLKLPGVGEKLVKTLMESGYDSLAAVADAETEDLSAIKGVAKKTAERLVAGALAMLSESGKKSGKEPS